jgi:large subunit ribosomal protein L22
MAFEAKLKYLRISPRKVRLVADMVRGKKVDEAQTILTFTVKKGAQPILKLLNSALANVKNNAKQNTDNLIISKIIVNEGPTLKRMMPRAKGRGDRIMKRTSHIVLVLDEDKRKNKKLKIQKKENNKKIIKKETKK